MSTPNNLTWKANIALVAKRIKPAFNLARRAKYPCVKKLLRTLFPEHANFVCAHSSYPWRKYPRFISSFQPLASLSLSLSDLKKKSLPRLNLTPPLKPEEARVDQQMHWLFISEKILQAALLSKNVTDTTIARPDPANENPVSEETGGLSGKPLFVLATNVLSYMCLLTRVILYLHLFGSLSEPATFGASIEREDFSPALRKTLYSVCLWSKENVVLEYTKMPMRSEETVLLPDPQKMYLADCREDRFGGVQEIYSCIFEFFRLLLGELELNQECNAT
ncbi:hypothetical protein C5167_044787 [Papaver somniferum]|nr:hypothetical protein C5167_044787 [Papaver somniferum]